MQDLFLRGLAFHRQGSIQEAQALYLQVLRHMPHHADALHQLGLLRRQQGRYGEAVALLRQAIDAKPGEAVFYSNLGNALRDLGNAAPAEEAYREAIRLQPEFAQAHNNLGVLLLRQRRASEAVMHLEHAVGLAPTFADAINNLGFARKDLGQIDEAMTCYSKALAIQPAHQDALYNLGNGAICLSDYEQALGHFLAAEQVNPSTHTGRASAVRAALIHYLRDQTGVARDVLARARVFPDAGQPFTYQQYLGALLDCRSKAPGQATATGQIHVIGESHALSAHAMVLNVNDVARRCQGWWIEGCKQWHLANDQPNRFKAQFNRIVQRVPLRSWLLLAIGEIDCRSGEGLLPAWRRSGGRSLASMIDATVGRFVDFVSQTTAAYGHKLVFCGVPAPNPPRELEDAHERQVLAELIAAFNAALHKKAMAQGHHFLDLHELTVGPEGFSTGLWHLDAHHLRPVAWTSAIMK
jgi:tetratricopeptide (TPR) repeat protein